MTLDITALSFKPKHKDNKHAYAQKNDIQHHNIQLDT